MSSLTLAVIAVLLLLWGCQKPQAARTPVARIDNQTLTLEEIEARFDSSQALSQAQVHEYIQRWLIDELLYRESLALAPVPAWSSPPAVERSVDLSRFAGEETWLMFRSRFRGEVRMNELDFKGFAMVWQDPRIELQAR